MSRFRQTDENTLQWFLSKVVSTWSRLTEPVASVSQPESRRRARLLSALLVILLPLSITGLVGSILVLAPQTVYRPSQDPFFYLALGMVVILAASYGLSRTRRYALGAGLVVSLLPVLTIAAAIIVPSGIDTLLVYLTINALLGSLLLPVRETTLLTAMGLVGVLLVPLASPHIGYYDLINSLSFNIIASSLVIVAAEIRRRDLLKIERQAGELTELYREVKQHADLLEQRVARRTAQLEARAHQQAIVSQLGQQALSGSDLNTLMQDVASLVSQTLQVENCAVLELLPQENVLLLRAGVGWGEGLVGHATLGARDVSKAAISMKPHLVASWLSTGTDSASVTIQGEQGPFGFLCAYTTDYQTFTDADIQFLQAIANILAQAIERKHAQVALQTSEEKYRNLFQDIPIGLYQRTPDGHMADANTALVTMLGYEDQEDLLVASITDLYVDGEQRTQWKNTLEREGTLLNFEVQLRRRDGEIIWIRENTRAIHDVSGRVLYYRGSMMDITAQQQAELNIRRRNRELSLLNKIIAASTSILNYEEMLEVACRELALAVKVSRCTAWLYDDKTVTAVAEYLDSDSALSSKGTVISVEQSPTSQHVVKHAMPLAVANAQQDPRVAPPARDLLRQYNIDSVLILPLVVRDEMVGTITLATTRRREFSGREQQLATNVAAAVSQSLHNARLYQELETYSEFLETAVKERTADLNREKERAEAILESAADAVLTFDSKGHILSANPAFEEQTQYNAQEVLGQHARVLAGSSLPRPIVDDLVEAISAVYPWRGEIITRRKDGSEYEANLNMAPLRDTKKNRALGYVAVMHDISASKQIERMKDAFVSNVSHELRTPITSLKLLHYGLQQASTEERQRILNMLRRETDRLHHIVEDVLRLSRLDQGQVELNRTPVDLNALTEEYIIDRAALAEGRLLTLTQNKAQNLPPVQADEGLLGQVLGVFLTNALNYTPEGGRIEVSTLVQKFDAQEWTGFSVSDTGPGIPREEQKRLFERFFRGVIGRESGAPGTGLGLAIASEIVKRHDGRIDVVSTGMPGEGTTFTVWLPARENTIENGST